MNITLILYTLNTLCIGTLSGVLITIPGNTGITFLLIALIMNLLLAIYNYTKLSEYINKHGD